MLNRQQKMEIPEKLWPFIDLGFDYHKNRSSGRNAFADCLFCGGVNKLYINTDNGFWDCKVCGRKGNCYSFMKEWYSVYATERDTDKRVKKQEWINLANDRQLPPEVLKKAGIIFDGVEYAIPVRNTTGSIVNIRLHRLGEKMMGLSGIEANVFGAEYLTQKGKENDRVFLVEGEYDAIALRWLLERSKQKGIVLGIPGAGMWKSAWTEFLVGRNVIIGYDNDTPGEKGTDRVYSYISKSAGSVSYIAWPSELPEGFDIRDFVSKDGTYKQLATLIRTYTSPEQKQKEKDADSLETIDINSKLRPKFSQVLSVYKKHLHMTSDLEDALKVIFAVVLSTRVEGDPLWIHIVAPPGGGKTVMLMSTAECPTCFPVSTLTPHSLVSGFIKANGEDPSLLPKLDGKVLVVKDYTEILAMPKVHKDELFGTLRGAYDGETTKQYGNGITRTYKCKFNMITGVTQQIYAERSASLGERFLMYHVIKGVAFDAEKEIRSAIANVNKEVKIKEEMTSVAARFLEISVNEEDIPELPDWVVTKLMYLSQLVAMLRASVERDFRTERKLLYRPQHEMGTRLAKQFTKLLMGLGLINSPASIGEEEYRILTRVAVDTMVGFNLEAIASLVEKPGQTMRELSADCSLAISTLSDQVDDLVELGAIKVTREPNPAGRGQPICRYFPSERLMQLWEGAELAMVNGTVKTLSREKKRLKVKLTNRKRIGKV